MRRLVGLGVLFSSFIFGLSQDPEFAYDLQPGDHLIYHYRFNRKVDNQDALKEVDLQGNPLFDPLRFEEHAEWVTHLLVLGVGPEGARIGTQRNLVGAELVRFERMGQNQLEAQRPVFAARAEAKRIFAEANIVGRSGRSRLAWLAAREWTSKLLYEFHEVLPLPPGAVHPGYSWSTGGMREMAFTVQGRRELGEETCLQVTGQSSSTTEANPYHLTISYAFCPGQGIIGEVEGGAVYTGLSFEENQETVYMQLAERRRGEGVAQWLADPELREGVLEAWLLPGSRPQPELLLPLLEASVPARVQRRALAVLFQHRLDIPASHLESLRDSLDPVVRRIAERVAKTSAAPAFSEPSGVGISVEEPGRQSAGSDASAASAVQLFQAPELQACRIQTGIPASRPSLRLGTYFTAMNSKGVEGWPMAVQVPLDYRGDEPFPLIINLAGNGGTAIEGIQASQAGLANSPYLVVYPHAGDFWWKERPMQVVDRLLREIHTRFNIDPNRVYLTGWSNGGTATFHFSSHWPHYLAAAVPIMGAGFWAPGLDLQGDVVAENLGNLPLLFLHGEKDRTIPVRESRETVRRLVWRQAPVEEHYYPTLGHELAPATQDEGKTLEFFGRHTRNPFPRSIRVGMHHLRYPRHYWVEVLEGNPAVPGVDGTFFVQGDISDDNVLRLSTRNIRRFRLLLRPELFAQPGPVTVIVNNREVFNGNLNHKCELLEESLAQVADPYLAYSSVLTLELSWSVAEEIDIAAGHPLPTDRLIR